MKIENPESVQKALIKDYIVKSINLKDLNNEVDIFSSGLTNSLFAIQLMTFIEKTFKVKITIEDLDMDNLKSVNSISAFIDYKKQNVLN